MTAIDHDPWCDDPSSLTFGTFPCDNRSEVTAPFGLMEPCFHLFVYGTLASPSGPASELMSECERVGPGVVNGTLYDIGAYPALLLGGEGRVEGEIWRCPADVLPRLDRYEGVGEGLFRRVGVSVDDTACWTYVAGPALGARLTPEARIRSKRWKS